VKVKIEGYDTTLEILVQRSNQILFLLSNEKSGIEFLWPNTLGYLNQPIFSPGLASILRNLTILLSKHTEDSEKLNKAFQTSRNLPKSESLLIRFILLCYVPFIFKDLGFEILNSLPTLFQALDNNIMITKPNELLNILSKLSC
jgi:hypothetical protein